MRICLIILFLVFAQCTHAIGKRLCKCGTLAIALLILNLFLSQNSFGQAGPLRLRGSGGTITEINVGGTFYEVHSYTATGTSTFTPPSGASNVEYLIVAGGGGGGRAVDRTGGGGGAGGVLTSSSFGVTVQAYPVTVGIGGTGGTTAGGGTPSTAGSNSAFATFTAIGGGRGGQNSNIATSGGSGGGGYHNTTLDAGRAGTAGQGNAGGNGYDSGNGTNGTFAGGGGGGASQAGANAVNTSGSNSNAGKGGDGLTSLISGSSVIYGGGGGGGFQRLGTGSGSAGAGGAGGGGAGGSGTNAASQNGTAGTANRGGGGGGGGGTTTALGGAGGSGIVIVRYKAPTSAITTQAPAAVISGSNFTQPLVIQILDGNGSPVPGIVVTAAIQSGTGGSLTNPTATTDASGNATFTNLRISGPGGNSFTLNFTVPGSTDKVISNSISLCGNITTTSAKNDVQCFNTNTGQIVITASGGTGPYAYSINNGANYSSPVPTGTFNNLSAGIYKIRVKDANGCESKSVQ